MVRTAFAIYRQWGYDIFKNIVCYQKKRNNFELDTLIIPAEYQFVIDREIEDNFHISIVDPQDSQEIPSILKKQKIDLLFLYSWSWIIKKPIFKDYICICLHPSPLPKYRGGTPIQNQLINDEVNSAVTLFKMSEGIDDGDIYQQIHISLLGDVNNIFQRMVDVGSLMTEQLITDAVNNELKFVQQKNLTNNPPYKRRTPPQSEISLKQLQKVQFKDLYNLVRGLLDPYPNAYINLYNQKLELQEVLFYNTLPVDGIILSEEMHLKGNETELYIKLKIGYAKVQMYRLATY